MAASPIFVSRLTRLPLVDKDGSPVGRVEDVVVLPSGRHDPRVVGFLVGVQRRKIFLNAGRVLEIEPTGVRMRSGSIDVRRYHRRPGERLATLDLIGSEVDGDHIADLAISFDDDREVWRITTIALAQRGPFLRRRPPSVVPWSQVAHAFDAGPEYAQVAEFREMHPSDVAHRLRQLPLAHRRRLAELMEDESLADLLEELDEDDQVRLIEGLDLDRLVSILEEMEPDDAADLLGEMPEEQRSNVLEAMEPEDSTSLRNLLSYGDDTAGGLMTPEPVVLAYNATVAEALATVRVPALPTALAAQVFVVRPPTSIPTGSFVGTAPIQRLLREPPSTELKDCVFDEPRPVEPEVSGREVAERLASYDALALPVCDHLGRLIGAVTVDDVLDHVLPEGWRRSRSRS